MSGSSSLQRRCAVLGAAIVLVAMLASGVLTALASEAGTAGSMIVTPSKVQLDLDRGATRTFKVQVSNTSPEVIQLNIRAVDFARDETGKVVLVPPEDADKFNGCSQWVRLPFSTSSDLEAGGSQQLEFEVSVPSDAPFGSRYCYLDITGTPQVPEPELDQDETGVKTTISYSMNALLLVNVGDSTSSTPVYKKDIKVKQLEVKRVNFSPTVDFRTLLYNAGNVHANLAEGSGIQIWSGDALKATIAFQEYTLLPKNTIAIPVTWNGSKPFGRYTARFVGEVGLDQPVSAERTFWVVNPYYLGGAIAGLVVVFALIVMFLKRFRIQLAPRS